MLAVLVPTLVVSLGLYLGEAVLRLSGRNTQGGTPAGDEDPRQPHPGRVLMARLDFKLRNPSFSRRRNCRFTLHSNTSYSGVFGT